MNVMIVSEIAPSRLFIATPISMTVPREAPHFLALRLTSITAANAPMKAKTDNLQPPYIPRAVQSVTASPAPEFTPIMLGDASRFASTPWITAPETASAAPQTRAASVLGSRM